jgi:hypothetical protein
VDVISVESEQGVEIRRGSGLRRHGILLYGRFVPTSAWCCSRMAHEEPPGYAVSR